MSSDEKLKVLLVDDDAVQLRLREAILRDAGFEVAVATSAAIALPFLNTPTSHARVRAILTDHLLPGETGADFVRKVRESHPNLPVLVITGMPGAEEDYGGLDVIFLMKPVSPDDLVKHVLAAISSENTA